MIAKAEVSPSAQEDEQAGWACLSFLITGSQRTGEVAVESERGVAGKDSVPLTRTAWQLRHLQVKVDGEPQAIRVIEGGSRCEGEEPPLQPEGEI